MRNAITVTALFTAILSPVFLNDCITFFDTIGKGIVSLLQEFVTGADSFGQLSNGISNSIISGIVYWLIVAIVMGILFIITGFLIIGIGYQVGKIYRKYCWDIISIMMAIMSTAIVIYFGEWIKSVIPINLIVLLLLAHVVYIGIRCYVKDWREERGLEQAAHGVYVSPDTWTDAMYILHLRCSQAVFSHETALFFHDLTDREPLKYTITVRTGYNPSRLQEDGLNVEMQVFQDALKQYAKRKDKNLRILMKSADAQILMRNYMMERFLERISLSEYKNQFMENISKKLFLCC